MTDRIDQAFNAASEPLPSELHVERVFTHPAGEDLPANAPDDDRVDAAMTVRENDYKLGTDLDWLLKNSDAARPVGARGPMTPAAEKFANKPGAQTLPGRIAGDLGMGAVEAPGQVLGGARDAVQSIIDLGDI